MLDRHVDGYNVAGQSVSPEEDDILPSNIPKVKTILPDVQTEKSEVESCTASALQDSFELDYSLPNLPMKSLMTRMDIVGKLREQGQVGDFLEFRSSSHLERAAEVSKIDACPVPYFIPELEMYCARAAAGDSKELNLAPVEEPNTLELKGLEPKKASPSQIEEISVPKMEEPKVLEVEATRLPEVHVPVISVPEIEESEVLEIEAAQQPEIHVPEIKKIGDINLTNLEEPEAPEMSGPSGVENATEQWPIIPAVEEPTSPIIIAQGPIPSPVIEKPMPVRGTGFVGSLIGHKPIWRPSVRLCFGDREPRRTQLEEEIKQQTSKALKALILYINLYKTFKECSQAKPQLNQMKRSRGTLTYSGVFEQNVFQPTGSRWSRQEEFPDALACGEPVQRNPVRIRLLHELDAGDGWDRCALDSDSSDSCDSEDSGIRTTLSLASFSCEMMRLKHPIADRQDIESSGRIVFSKPVTLFRFNSAKQWQREDNLQSPSQHPYTGNIQILERHGLHYILLREKNSAFLLVYTRIDGNWNISYMANTTDSCGWFNFNYAYCAEGTPEHFACTFQETSHAAEFVTRVRNIVIRARFLD